MELPETVSATLSFVIGRLKSDKHCTKIRVKTEKKAKKIVKLTKKYINSVMKLGYEQAKISFDDAEFMINKKSN